MKAPYIVVGKVHFAVEHLEGQTLSEVKAMFPHINVEIVKAAWLKANPKKKK